MKTRIFLLLLLTCLLVMTVRVYGSPSSQSAVIKGNNVNFRAEPGLESPIIALLNQGLSVTIMEQIDSWYKVQLPDGRNGWIYYQFIGIKSPASVASRGNFMALPVDGMVAYAKNLLEIKYVYGGDTLQGFDCSGFTMYVFAKFGISLPHQANLQVGTGVEVLVREDLLPGDLVFFRTEGSTVINHVGIYLGDQQFVHASSGYGAVRVSPLDSGYYNYCYAGGRRLITNNGGDEPDESEPM